MLRDFNTMKFLHCTKFNLVIRDHNSMQFVCCKFLSVLYKNSFSVFRLNETLFLNFRDFLLGDREFFAKSG